MAALFLWCDLAITGDGLTKYETAVTGTPSIIVARPDSNARINANFIAGGTAVCAEPGADGRWAGLPPAIRCLVEGRAAREAMSRRGRQLVDGRGLDRVLDRITIA
jgi:spore coat polysaccharide biosynthesis predicted glycosyltransferase SpsG